MKKVTALIGVLVFSSALVTGPSLSTAGASNSGELFSVKPISDSAVQAASIETLIAWLADTHADARIVAAIELGRRHDAAAIPSLRATLADNDPLVRMRVAEALLRLNVTDGLPVLKELLSNKDHYAALGAAGVLAGRGDADAMQILRSALTSRFAMYRLQAIKGLLTGGTDDDALTAFQAATKDQEAILLQALWAIRSGPQRPWAARELQPLVSQDQRKNIREAAVLALRGAPKAQAVPVLLPLLGDPSLGVRVRALDMLSKLTGRMDLKPAAIEDPAKAKLLRQSLEQWWSENKDKPLPSEAAPAASSVQAK